ncbi:hypothetical protein KIKIMORA_04630 [Brevundimonas phage vB_BpoS-Kikimora]|uniref:Uncharacterized protein n=1 Tax=Brevundimonas phage vB_BpoS-Kikimora TaxID=2948601 RepID=A0A9E7SL96_9CAUD|nr:hypothetical protein KIKIMORA_04630 [Brevundimonas phage vB_BpoS-Kikimora]
MTALAPVRTPENTTFKPGQIVTYEPYYMNGSVTAEVLGLVENPPFADVPLYRIRLMGDLPPCSLPHYGPEGGSTDFPAVSAGEEVPNALWHCLHPL